MLTKNFLQQGGKEENTEEGERGKITTPSGEEKKVVGGKQVGSSNTGPLLH